MLTTFCSKKYKIDDCQSYQKYKHHRKWFNKLWLSECLDYHCGPAGIPPDRTDHYVVRPIYNLSGMSVGSEIKHISKGDVSSVPPGYFWCQKFEGTQYSVTYEFVHATSPYWKPISSWEGVKDDSNLSKFHLWKRSDIYPSLPRIFNELSDVRRINIEFIGDKPIEVHLRESPDPDYDILIPVWKGEENTIDKYVNEGYNYVNSYDDADGFLKIPRLGFLVK